MSLHRSLAPDWEAIPADKQSKLQQLAQRTHGIITPANIVSLAGLIIVLVGLGLIANASYVIGVAVVVLGRLADLLDGYVAHKTMTKSPLGEAVDASIDKFAAAVAIVLFTFADILPLWVSIALAVHTVYGTAIYLLARRKGSRVHPSRSGKLITALSWALLTGWVLFAATGWQAVQHVSVVASGLFTLGAIYVIISYWRQYRAL